MNSRVTRAFGVLVSLGLLAACSTDKVAEAPKIPEPAVTSPVIEPPVETPKPAALILNIRPSVTTGTIEITETRAFNGALTRATTSRPAVFTFRAGPGSASGSILEYRITSDRIGSSPNLIDPRQPPVRTGLNIFVQSGFACTPAPPAEQNCIREGSTPADGLESATVAINSSHLEAFMIANRSSASETFTIEFLGLDENGQTFTISVHGLAFVGWLNPAA
jgi:hypothetical protein